ncbi:hypothetical protein D8Y22_15235 [Salinadaptatus halalkaliphilus]|uniref:HTH bat-type domain-containing protein n=1 Tax=Salinadaptatus halalkaliphilus TaxID=2419781 RepID=A0A4S3TJ49_9EURY|nr:hypothetical protein D8Y22_15235 [Salinadaptatus halalkaliphilus]
MSKACNGLAYYSGYFNQPRDRTGEEIAEALGISQPAFFVATANGTIESSPEAYRGRSGQALTAEDSPLREVYGFLSALLCFSSAYADCDVVRKPKIPERPLEGGDSACKS